MEENPQQWLGHAEPLIVIPRPILFILGAL